MKIAAFVENCSVFAANSHWTTGSAENVYEADFFNLEIVPPEFAALPVPCTCIEPAFIVIEAVEDELIFLPILGFLDVESLETDGMLSVRCEHFYFGVLRRKVIGFNPE